MDGSATDYLVVRVGSEDFGFPTGRVETAIEYRQPTPLPGRPGPFLGALNHHGELLPVAPLAVLLGQPVQIDPERAVIVVLTWEDALLGLVVEGTEGILTPPERARVTHVLGKWDGPFLAHTLEIEGRRIHVLAVNDMLADLARRI